MVFDELVKVEPSVQAQPARIWPTEMQNTISGLSVRTPQESVGGEFLAFSFAGARLYYMHSGPQNIFRARPCPRNRFAPMVIVPLQGAITISQLGRSCHVEAGQFAYLDSAAALSLEYPDEFRHLYLHLPPSGFTPAAFHKVVAATVTPKDDFDTAFLRLIECVWRNAEDLVPTEHAAALNSIVSLCKLTAPIRESMRSPEPCIRVRRAMSYIEHYLAEPWLTPQTVAEAQGVSRRHLDDLFGKLDLSIERWIWERRLVRAQEELEMSARSANSGKTIIQIALDSGFKSPSHFSRAFSTRFGASPRDYRNEFSVPKLH